MIPSQFLSKKTLPVDFKMGARRSLLFKKGVTFLVTRSSCNPKGQKFQLPYSLTFCTPVLGPLNFLYLSQKKHIFVFSFCEEKGF